MNIKKIDLKIPDESIIALVGIKYGKQVFKSIESEVQPYTFDQLVITFPKHIQHVSISFVDGFSSVLLSRLGKSEFTSKVKIQGNHDLIERFNKIIL